MNYIILFTEKDEWQPDSFCSANEGKAEGGSYVVQSSKGWLGIHQSAEVFADYDEDELQAIKSLMQNPEAFIIEWRGQDMLDKFIKDFPENINSVVDNDHGIIVSIQKLKGIPVSMWLNKEKIY